VNGGMTPGMMKWLEALSGRAAVKAALAMRRRTGTADLYAPVSP
jgi:hypothetical protein